MENEVPQSLSLKIIVEKRKNQVVFVESNKDFIDVLFSFMMIPIGTIARFTREHSLGGEIGCLNNLYESIKNFDVEYVQSQKCWDILLHPRSAAEIYCQNLKHNLMENHSNKYYACPSSNCSLLSCYLTPRCRCGEGFKFELSLPIATSVPQMGSGFVKPTVNFMISDDFKVKPMSTMTGISFLMSKLGVADGKTLEQKTVSVGRDELLKLLKCSLTSRTPFSDTFMGSPSTKTFYKISHGKYGPRSTLKATNAANKEKMISLKLIVSESKNKALFAEVKKDFLDLLSSFLTVPLGYVFKEFPFLAFRGCVNNLYQSIENVEVELFESEGVKETLVNPKLAPGLAYNNQLTGIEEAINPSYSTLTSLFLAKRSELSPGSQLVDEVKIGEGLVKGPSVFMVMDNLTVKPLSPFSGISLINDLQIPLGDIGEREVTMGEDEACRLLVASLVSRCALTDTFMLKEPKQEE
ncbi:hypothetical protein LguiA_027016 [Lonicera macranthoides]